MNDRSTHFLLRDSFEIEIAIEAPPGALLHLVERAVTARYGATRFVRFLTPAEFATLSRERTMRLNETVCE